MVLRSGTNEPIAGVTVGAFEGDAHDSPVLTATTDNKGAFELTNLRDLAYTLKFKKEGYVSQFLGEFHIAGLWFMDEVKASSTGTGGVLLSSYITKVARLGGYLARASDGPPGNTVMWRGLSRLTDIALGFEAAKLVGN